VSVVLIEIDIIEAFLISACSGCSINTGLENAEISLFICNRLVLVAAGATLYWEIIRVHEEVATSCLLKF